MKTMNLEQQDIKLLKGDMRFGAVVAVSVIAVAAVLTFAFILAGDVVPAVWIAVIAAALVLLAVLLYVFMNGSIMRDLRSGRKTMTLATVQAKEEEPSYEVGSGVLYIPILGDLFPKLWGQKMRRTDVYYMIVDNVKYKVDREIYDAVEAGGQVRMYHTAPGGNFLSFLPVGDQ